MTHSAQLYLISPPTVGISAFKESLAAALSAGNVGAFQLRLKQADDDSIKHAIRELMPVCRDAGVAFIINDRPDLCAEFSCDGVHIGQEDLINTSAIASWRAHEAPLEADSRATMAAIRDMVGDDAVIGVTCHASKHLAMEAGEAGADYVAFGAFYPTTSKPAEKLAKWGTPTTDILEWWHAYMTLPCVAIGGINPNNCSQLIQAGADFIAVINAVWNHPQGPAAAVKAFEVSLCQSSKMISTH